MEFDEIVVKESPGLCRCCLSEGCYKDLGTEYTWMDETEVYADILLECFDISISQHMEGPNGPNRLICEVCITRLRDACNFKKQVLDSEKKFVDMVGRGEFKSKVIVYQEQMKSEMIVEPQPAHDADVEYLDEEIDYDDGNKDDSNEPTVSEDITVDALPIKGKRGRPKKSTVKPEKKKSKLEEKTKPKIVKDVNGPVKRISANKLRRLNLQILFHNTSVIPFKWRGKYLCFYCGEDFKSYENLKEHTKDHGVCSDKDRALRLVKSADVEVKIDVSQISCNICHENFMQLEEIISHLVDTHNLPYDRRVNLSIAPYRLSDLSCLMCDEKFNYLKKLIVHVNTDHPSQDLNCVQCQQKFNKTRDLDAHIRTKHRNHICSKCFLNFRTRSELLSHKRVAHTFKCNVCIRSFSSIGKCFKHIKNDHTGAVMRCGFSVTSLTSKQGFHRHAIQCTDNCKKSVEAVTLGVDKKPCVTQIRDNIACIFNMSTAIPFKYFMSKFRCFYCPKDFNECDDLKQHTITEHPLCDTKLKSMKLRHRHDGVIKVDTSSLSCKICFENIQDLESLIKHLHNEHKIYFDKSLSINLQSYKLIKDNFPCPFCGDVFRYFRTLLNHVVKMHSDNKNICMHCGMAFRNAPNLRTHIARHHKAANFKCSECDLSFFSNYYLQTHLGRVHGTKVVECLQCHEKFTSVYEMQRHKIDVHGTGHECSYCHKLFTGKSSVVDHIRRTHLKEKNVACTVCLEKFFDRQSLKVHMVKHYGERNFHCDICGKKFLWKKNLREHMTSHTKSSTSN
ncbi:zinc finger protein 135-like isoform X4 [Vanessa tameamea]|uniref:Zinc finger protein 135-like isoform X4 n=1 Tax=Vanessa tameamea TaxID=334116 RepID=A0ABM4AXE3_VANTA